MYPIHKFITIFAAITTSLDGLKKINLSTHPVLLCLSLINFIVEVLSQTFIAYTFPTLFVCWVIINDSVFQLLLNLTYNKMIKKMFIKKQVNKNKDI